MSELFSSRVYNDVKKRVPLPFQELNLNIKHKKKNIMNTMKRYHKTQEKFINIIKHE